MMNTIKEELSIDTLMTKHPITIGYEDTIQKSSELMLEYRFRHLPVTDQNGNVIGILSDRDIQRAMETRHQGIEVELVLAPGKKVKDFMSWPPHTVSNETSLIDVVTFMIQEKISALLVNSTKTGKTIGIVTSEDVLKEFLKYLKK